MRQLLQRCLVCAMLVGIGSMSILGVSPAQEAKKESTPTTAPETKKGATPVPGNETVIRGQLPPYWGKLSLSDEQKQKIYQIQSKFNGEIARLEAQVKELRAKRDQEMRSVLTEEQKKRLEELLLKKIK